MFGGPELNNDIKKTQQRDISGLTYDQFKGIFINTTILKSMKLQG